MGHVYNGNQGCAGCVGSRWSLGNLETWIKKSMIDILLFGGSRAVQVDVAVATKRGSMCNELKVNCMGSKAEFGS